MGKEGPLGLQRVESMEGSSHRVHLKQMGDGDKINSGHAHLHLYSGEGQPFGTAAGSVPISLRFFFFLRSSSEIMSATQINYGWTLNLGVTLVTSTDGKPVGRYSFALSPATDSSLTILHGVVPPAGSIFG